MSKQSIIVGSILCIIASMSWGAMFPVAHRAFEHIHPFYFSVIRYTAVSVILIAALWWKEGKAAFRLDGRGKELLFFGTMAFTVYNLLIFMGQHLMGETGTVVASIGESLMPMISVVILWFAARSRPSKGTLASVCIALIGAVLVITKGDLSFVAAFGQHFVPIALIVAAVVGWVLYSIGGTQFQDWSTLRYSTMTCLFGTTVSFVITSAGSFAGFIPVPSVQDVLAAKFEMAFMVVLPGIIALLGWNAGIKKISAVNGTLFINFVPITTFVIMACQGYHISAFEVIGTLLIMVALIGSSMEQRRTMPVKTIKVKPKVRGLKSLV